ncbi:hypothetical protein [Bacillus salipaludis]|uniref:Fur-regulated basic protein FbpA n=1 Tax=Bacillus salipaludis TaxID=2547811 RepID=A0ABW8RJG6_9BACI
MNNLMKNITNYMIAKGIYHPSNLKEQLLVDLQITDTALNLADTKL